MTNYVKTFFYPRQYVFTYNLPYELIIQKLNEIFFRKSNFFDFNNLIGEFKSKDSFEICMKSVAIKNGLLANTILICEIIKLENNQTIIKMKAKLNVGLLSWFFISTIISLIYLIIFFQTYSYIYIVSSLLTLLAGPLLCIVISCFQIGVIIGNYTKYIDNKLV